MGLHPHIAGVAVLTKTEWVVGMQWRDTTTKLGKDDHGRRDKRYCCIPLPAEPLMLYDHIRDCRRPGVGPFN